jgi:hypothetical protein
MQSYEIQPPDAIVDEMGRAPVAKLLAEAVDYLKGGGEEIDDIALARMFIQRGYSEDFAYWLVREAEVRRAPGHLPEAPAEPLI